MLEEKELEPTLEERLQALKGPEGEESLEKRLRQVNETTEQLKLKVAREVAEEKQ